jgi:hypothetical protein
VLKKSAGGVLPTFRRQFVMTISGNYNDIAVPDSDQNACRTLERAFFNTIGHWPPFPHHQTLQAQLSCEFPLKRFCVRVGAKAAYVPARVRGWPGHT